MPRLLIWLYTLFFATGFMGASALLLLEFRLRSGLLMRLLVFQLLMMTGMGLIVLYLSPAGAVAGPAGPAGGAAWLLMVITVINTAVWGMVVMILRRVSLARTAKVHVAQVLAVIVAVKNLANAAVMAVEIGGEPVFSGTAAVVWTLGGHVVGTAAMAAFGLVLLGPIVRDEPRALHPLLRAYGICALVFAPVGIIEYAVEAAGIDWLPSISLDHLFYLAWNVVSISAAVRLFRPTSDGTPVLESVPPERVKALGLSPREVEMAVLIARGMANKQIASELRIAPGTVRTHIYNLYRKVGAGSRVELLNKLSD